MAGGEWVSGWGSRVEAVEKCKLNMIKSEKRGFGESE